MLTTVYDRENVIETVFCRRVVMPDGSTGVEWRGLVYPVASGDRIDVAGPASLAADCYPGEVEAPRRARYTIVAAGDGAYVLVDGFPTDRDALAAGLRSQGLTVRAGRYFGDAVEGVEADWFVRVAKPAGAEPDSLLATIEAALGRGIGPPIECSTSSARDVRLRLLADQLSQAQVRETRLRAELTDRLATDARRSEILEAALARQRAELAAERAHRQQVELERADVTAEPAPAAREASTATLGRGGKLLPELTDVFALLLPQIFLVRESMTVLAAEFASRRSLYRCLAELQAGEGRLPPQWKKLKGTLKWWERHVSNGNDDSGRLYARPLADPRGWAVLISHKAEQAQDFNWLARQ